MTHIAVRLILGAGLVLPGAFGAAQTDSKISGHWQGKIQIPERELTITVDLAQGSNGAWIGSMSVVGSTAIDVPLESVAVDDTGVRFAANLPDRAAFDGRLSADGNSLAGKASNAAGEAPFQLTRDGEAKVKLPPPSSALTKEFEGDWEGSIDAGGRVRKIALKLTRVTDGSAGATLVALDQNMQIPVASVTIADKQLQLLAPAVSGSYKGTLGATGEIAGEWSQGPNHIPLTFRHAPR